MKLLLATVFLACVLAVPAQASTSWMPYTRHTLTPLDTQFDSSGQRTIQNPTDCAWNDQDDIADEAYGSLKAGESTSRTICLIADYDDHGCATCIFPKAVVVNVSAPKSSLASVTLRDDQGDSWVLPSNSGSVATCIADPVADRFNIAPGGDLSGTYPLIPGSSGGRGLQVNYTLTITASKRISNLSSYLEIHGGGGNAMSFPEMLTTACPKNDGL